VYGLWHDLKFGVRTLAKSPGFTAVAILTLALGIGANTAIFSVVNTVLIKALPFPDPDRMIMFATVYPQGFNISVSDTKFNELRTRTDAFQDISAYRFGVMNLTGDSDPEQVRFGQVSADFFHLFGAPITQGRAFTPDEDRPNGGRVILISDGFWKRRLGGDLRVIGKIISLGGESYEIIGVVGPKFDLQRFDPVPDVWLPFPLNPKSKERATYFVAAGRLKPGVTMAIAAVPMKLATDEYQRRFPDDTDGWGPGASFAVKPLREIYLGDIRPSLRILVVAVVVVLLIACANVANLQLVRATSKQREVAIRMALGSTPGRIVRQLLTESLLLSLAGGVLGFLFGIVGIRALLAINPGNIPRVGLDGGLVTADWRVVFFTVAVSVLTGLLFGLFPALQVSRVDLSSTLKEGGARSGSGVRQNRIRSVLVISELALAVILLVGSSLLIRTFIALRNLNPGYETHNVLTISMSLSGPRFEKTANVTQLMRNGLDRIRALPGVASVGAACFTPLEGGYGLTFLIAGRPIEGFSQGIMGWITIWPGYFEALKIPIKRGRAFTDADNMGSAPVVIINETMARKFWPQSDPLNDQLTLG